MNDSRGSTARPTLNRRRALGALSGAALAPWLLAPRRAAAATAGFEVIHEFTGGAGGAYPASLMFRADGALYGVTESGGRQSRGTVFRIAGGRFRTAHAFINGEAQPGGLDGGKIDPLVEGPDGALYGTTFDGGNFQKGLSYRIYGEADTLMQLHHFTGGESDGMSPNDQLTVGADGALYGTGVRVVGGWNQVPQAYRMSLDGNITQLAQIGSWLNGLGRLTLASEGNFYTLSMLGGASGHGGAYRMAPDGTLTPVYSVAFDLPTLSPSGGFVQHANGLLYGTTENDPEGQQFGTVFRMTLEGRVKILHRFSGTDGAGRSAWSPAPMAPCMVWPAKPGRPASARSTASTHAATFPCCMPSRALSRQWAAWPSAPTAGSMGSPSSGPPSLTAASMH